MATATYDVVFSKGKADTVKYVNTDVLKATVVGCREHTGTGLYEDLGPGCTEHRYVDIAHTRRNEVRSTDNREQRQRRLNISVIGVAIAALIVSAGACAVMYVYVCNSEESQLGKLGKVAAPPPTAIESSTVSTSATTNSIAGPTPRVFVHSSSTPRTCAPEVRRPSTKPIVSTFQMKAAVPSHGLQGMLVGVASSKDGSNTHSSPRSSRVLTPSRANKQSMEKSENPRFFATNATSVINGKLQFCDVNVSSTADFNATHGIFRCCESGHYNFQVYLAIGSSILGKLKLVRCVLYYAEQCDSAVPLAELKIQHLMDSDVPHTWRFINFVTRVYLRYGTMVTLGDCTPDGHHFSDVSSFKGRLYSYV